MKTKIAGNKKYEGNIIHFCLFLILTLLYLYAYDHSFSYFLDNVKQVLNSKFHDHYVLNATFWLVGFWGIVHLLNHTNTYVKIGAWILLIITSLINYIYLKTTNAQLDLESAKNLKDNLEQFFSIPFLDSLPYIGFSIVLILTSIFLRPLSVGLGILLACLIILAIIGSFVVSHGQSIQEFYSTPLILVAQFFNH